MNDVADAPGVSTQARLEADLNDQTVDPEDQYFAAEDVEKLRRLAREQKQKLQAEDQERLRALHHMKCPKCGLDLQPLNLKEGDVEVDVCMGCHGVWLDAGELEQLQKNHRDPQRSFMGAVLNLFRGK